MQKNLHVKCKQILFGMWGGGNDKCASVSLSGKELGDGSIMVCRLKLTGP